MTHEQNIFAIIQSYENDHDKYCKIVSYIENVIKDTKGTENARFYNNLINLENSINNTGCENRRSNQIDFLWKLKNKIIDKYEKYLP